MILCRISGGRLVSAMVLWASIFAGGVLRVQVLADSTRMLEIGVVAEWSSMIRFEP